jgi:hypothetical protein
MKKRTIAAILIALAVLSVALVPASAFAYKEGGGTVGSACKDCHGETATKPASIADTGTVTGPHMGYTSTSRKCQTCHKVHDAPVADAKLLPAATIKGTCNICHDGTGGYGVYDVLENRGYSVAARHRIETTGTNQVPGGDESTGDTATVTFGSADGSLTCTDCHTPHGYKVVAAFRGDRKRTATDVQTPIVSTRLLKKRPTGATADVAYYGSSWCLGCHKGRRSMGVVGWTGPVNHPVATDSVATYNAVISMASYTATSSRITTGLGGANLGYVMTQETVGQLAAAGAGPICQQCHEDTRNAGTLADDGLTAHAADFQVASYDGTPTALDNPPFQVFPHESDQRRFLVETDDNLCLNCHSLGYIP